MNTKRFLFVSYLVLASTYAHGYDNSLCQKLVSMEREQFKLHAASKVEVKEIYKSYLDTLNLEDAKSRYDDLLNDKMEKCIDRYIPSPKDNYSEDEFKSLRKKAKRVCSKNKDVLNLPGKNPSPKPLKEIEKLRETYETKMMDLGGGLIFKKVGMDMAPSFSNLDVKETDVSEVQIYASPSKTNPIRMQIFRNERGTLLGYVISDDNDDTYLQITVSTKGSKCEISAGLDNLTQESCTELVALKLVDLHRTLEPLRNVVERYRLDMPTINLESYEKLLKNCQKYKPYLRTKAKETAPRNSKGML